MAIKLKDENDFCYLTGDHAVKIVFSDEYRFKNLIARITGIDVSDIAELKFENVERYGEQVGDKWISLDLAATVLLKATAVEKLKSRNPDLFVFTEMQGKPQSFYATRIYLQAARIASKLFKKGVDWDDTIPIIGINLLREPPVQMRGRLFVEGGLYGKDIDNGELFPLSSVVTFYFVNLQEAHDRHDNGNLDTDCFNLLKLLSADSKAELENLERIGDPFIASCVDRLKKANRNRKEHDAMNQYNNVIRDIDEIKAEGRAESKIETLLELVCEGFLSLSQAAKKTGKNEQELKNYAQEHGIKLA